MGSHRADGAGLDSSETMVNDSSGIYLVASVIPSVSLEQVRAGNERTDPLIVSGVPTAEPCVQFNDVTMKALYRGDVAM